MISCQKLKTAIRYGIPIVILLNDNAFGFIKWEQKKINFEDFGLQHGNPDSSLFAESVGLQISRSEKKVTLQKFWRNFFSLMK